jgi:glycine/D-amino acid oxidase-like deaminating enzyme
VHHYGHGGSGWSLSWGSAAEAIALVKTTGAREIAVIGCGAIGLTTAVAAQRAGFAVTIYTRELPPDVRSNHATGVWSPDSRICTAEHAEAFGARWEQMTRLSHRRFQNLLGLPGHPVEHQDMYHLSDRPFGGPPGNPYPNEPPYPRFSRERTPDLEPGAVVLDAAANPFAVPHVRRSSLMLFNISAYTQFLLGAFARLGGRLEIRELHGPQDFAGLREHTVVNCTGYGARALLGDESLIPVRGQTAKLIPQPEVQYGVQYWDAHVAAYPRRDGILVQAGADTDFGNASEALDRQESLTAVARLNAVMQGLRGQNGDTAP